MSESFQPKVSSSDSPRGPVVNGPDSPKSPAENVRTTVVDETPDSPSSGQFISRARASTTASFSSATGSLRRGTLRLLETDTPLGMWAATANATSQAPTLGDIRSGRVGRQGSLVGEEVHGYWERRGSSFGENGERARSGTNSSLGVATPGTESKRSRARTNSSLSMGTPKTSAKRQGSFGLGVGKKSSGDDLATTPASFPSVRERDEEANHGIVEELREEPSLEGADTKKAPLTEEEIAQVRMKLLLFYGCLAKAYTRSLAPIWLHRASKTSLDNFNSHWSESLLEVVHYAFGLSHHHLRLECRCLGRYAVPPSLRCLTCNVSSHLQ